MESIVLPIVKNKVGDFTDVDNYRTIALSNAETKILEFFYAIIRLSDKTGIDIHQLAFKKGHSTGLCTNIRKQTVSYYLNRGSHVFSCFTDYTKALDRVNYWKLFGHMPDECSGVCFVKLLAFWYANQTV